MVSPQHEALHRVFRDNPELYGRAFKMLDIPFPTPREVAVVDTDMTEIAPIERRADTVMMFTSTLGRHVVVSESQSQEDKDKPAAWAYYVAYLHAKFGCPVTLLVTCQDVATARWARDPKEIGLPERPSLVLRPIVLGPDNVPMITSVAEASEDVVLAMYSALTHGRSRHAAGILEPLAAALDTIDTKSAGHIAEQTEIGLGDTEARRIWRALMATKTYRYQSEYAQMLRAEGEAKGRAEGQAEGEARILLRILERRRLCVSEEARRRITSCTDTALLEAWADRALTATAAEEIFDAGPQDALPS
ncbi:hypothetical protein AB0L05_20020 [Nonomuraea pusilla]|uniref:hypothetical protein n=1 Tax=Nonomuraea pusilla TaxID=46177 RepID=UPI00331C25D6